MNEVTDRDFGKVEAKVEELEAKMDKVQTTLDEIKATLSEAKGGWKTLIAVGTVAGAIGAGATKVINLLGK